MDWTKEEKAALFDANTCGSERDILAVAKRAVELVSARGGTMTAEELTTDLETTGRANPQATMHLRQHISAQGARIAALEGDLEIAKRKRPATFEMEKELEKTLAERDVLKSRIDVLREKASTCESEMLRARSQCETLKNDIQTMTDLRDGYRKAGALEHERAEKAEAELIPLYNRMANAELNYEATSAVLGKAEAHIDAIRRRSLEASNLERLIAQKGLPAAMRWVVDGEDQSSGFNVNAMLSPVELHYPCSQACTHDDAANPGHSERVKARSEAFNEAAWRTANPEADDYDTALVRGREEGAEAMRAACWEVVVRVSQTLALGPTEREMFKHAIEGATP